MSIHEVILDHVSWGRLARLMPTIPGDPAVKGRRLFLSKDVMDLVDTYRTKAAEARRCEAFRQELDDFVKGGQVGVCLRPFEANEDAKLGLLHPPEDGIWDIRSVNPSPGLRVVGAFAEKNSFIGLEWAPRSKEFLGRQPLGDRNSREWRDIIGNAKAHWRRLFSSWEPRTGDKLDEYLSTNCHLV